MKNKILLLSFCLVFYLNKTQAQLKFKNQSENPIGISVAYYFNGEDFEGYASFGWKYVEPGETVVLIEDSLNQQTYFIYGKDKMGNEWKGASGKYQYFVDISDNFSIKNADKLYHLDEGKESIILLPFKKIEVGKVSTFTIKTNDLD